MRLSPFSSFARAGERVYVLSTLDFAARSGDIRRGARLSAA